jgi:hypothetical protein
MNIRHYSNCSVSGGWDIDTVFKSAVLTIIYRQMTGKNRYVM